MPDQNSAEPRRRRARSAWIAGAILCVGCVMQQPADATPQASVARQQVGAADAGIDAAPSRDDVAERWGVPPELDPHRAEPIVQTWSRREGGFIPMSDGVELRYSVLLPKGAGPFPVILNYSGYDPGAIGGSEYVHDNTAMSTDLDASLLERGYAVLGVNARGTGCSTGNFDFLGPAYGHDGAQIVEWAARQPWSSGDIGMANWSWAGMSQVATASEAPAHLRAIAPGMVLTDPRADSWAIGGVPSQGFVTGWWQYLHSRWLSVRRSALAEGDMRCVAQVDENYRRGETPEVNLPTLLIRHPQRDAWLDARTILNRVDGISVPVLSMESFQDEATVPRAGHYQDRLDPDQLWFVQTNGMHDLYDSHAFRAILLDFLDRFVKGVPNGFEARPHVLIWQETYAAPDDGEHTVVQLASPRWDIASPEYPPAVVSQTFMLSEGGTLRSLESPSGAPDAYDYPVPGPGVNDDPRGSSWGALTPGWERGSLAYTSDVLDTDMVIHGSHSVDLWLSSTAADTDLQVTLTELRPDGQERYVQRGWLRMSERRLDPALSTVLLPVRCDRVECVQALTPERPELGRVELPRVSYTFRRGARVRIWIDAPSATGGNSFESSSLRAINRIWHDADHPSRIVLGVLPDIVVPPVSASCQDVLMQPCRTDPLAAAASTKTAR